MQKMFASLRGLIAFLSILLLLLQGCTTIKAPQITPDSINQYKYQQEKDNLHIAVNPILESERIEDTFGIDLLSYGVLPVYIVIENQSGTTYLVEKKQIAFSNQRKKSNEKDDYYPFPVTHLKASTGEVVTGLAVFPIYFVVTPLVALADIGINMNTKDKREQVIHNMIKSELPDQTITPKQKVYGFVYFPIEKESSFLNEPCQLWIQLKNLKNKNMMDVVIDISK